jgi:Zn-dependent peptidase ImmA (M78 family)
VAVLAGAFFPGQRKIGDGLTDDEFYRSELSNTQEAEANSLAADILMPFKLLNELTADGMKDLDQLAARFGVSQPALRIRLGIPVAA